MAILALLVAAPYALPERLGAVALPGGHAIRLRLLEPVERTVQKADPEAAAPSSSVGEVAVPQAVDDTSEASEAADTSQHRFLGAQAEPDTPEAPLEDQLSDPTGEALKPLLAALARVDQKQPGATARVLYYGDSVVAFDRVTSTLRRRLQARFGDAGRGFVLPINAWVGYHQEDVARFASSGWFVSRVTGPHLPDSNYGIGGVSFRSEEEGLALLGTARGPFSRTASRFVISYAAQPSGGELSVRVDDREAKVIATALDHTEPRYEEIAVPDGPHRLEIRAGKGPVRLFGVELLRDDPGAIVDALGIMSSRMYQLLDADEASWAAAIAHARPAMIALAIGINDVSDGVRSNKVFERHPEVSRAMVKRIRKAAPDATCLVVGPLDRGAGANDPYTNKGFASKVNETLRQIARDEGCAFWDIFALMGGQGGMAEWARKGLGAADYMHPSPRGAVYLGNALADSIERRFDRYKQSLPARSP